MLGGSVGLCTALQSGGRKAGGPGQHLCRHLRGHVSSPGALPGIRVGTSALPLRREGCAVPVLGRPSGCLHPQHAPASTSDPRGLTRGKVATGTVSSPTRAPGPLGLLVVPLQALTGSWPWEVSAVHLPLWPRSPKVCQPPGWLELSSSQLPPRPAAALSWGCPDVSPTLVSTAHPHPPQWTALRSDGLCVRRPQPCCPRPVSCGCVSRARPICVPPQGHLDLSVCGPRSEACPRVCSRPRGGWLRERPAQSWGLCCPWHYQHYCAGLLLSLDP